MRTKILGRWEFWGGTAGMGVEQRLVNFQTRIKKHGSIKQDLNRKVTLAKNHPHIEPYWEAMFHTWKGIFLVYEGCGRQNQTTI